MTTRGYRLTGRADPGAAPTAPGRPGAGDPGIARTVTPFGHAAPMRKEEPRVPRLSREELIGRLRADRIARPRVDPGLAGGLRDWLEDGLADDLGTVPAGIPALRVSKHDLSRVLTCEAHQVASRKGPTIPTVELARGSIVDALFRQWITVGAITDPLGDGLEALALDGDLDGVGRFVESLDAAERAELTAEVSRQAAIIAAQWPVPPSAWLARTQPRLTVPLGGGRVLLTGVADLVFGGPAGSEASVCIVEVKSGPRRVEHRADLHFYALLETLRSGAAPFRVATYYSATGDVDVEAVTEEVLTTVVPRVLEGVHRLCRLAAGGDPARVPNPLCPWCADLPHCAVGRADPDEPAGATRPVALTRSGS